MDHSSDNKRVAKNTAFLYFRMLFLTCISLYTVRITLDVLGVVDYGIYNVVASVVASLSFLNSTLTSATQRFLSFHLGKRDYIAYSRTFSMLLIGYAILGAIVLAVGEIIGIFFIDDWLKIPSDRIFAAKCIYQTAIFSFIINMLIVPFSSSIIANEKMSAFSYLSILDGILRLSLVFLLVRTSFDKLIYYGCLNLGAILIVFIVYVIYCRIKFPFCKFKIFWDKLLFTELTSYTGWNLFGSISGVCITQGQNIILNIFFGPIINAAKAISDKVSSVVNSFSTNFYMAVNPQIIKSYAAGEIQRMLNLGLTSSRLSFFLLLCLSYPLIICMKNILYVWLGSESVTETMIQFSQLTLIYCLVTSLEQPITQMIRATGNIRNYQIRVGIWTLMYIPIAAIVLYYGAKPTSTMIVLILLYIFVQGIRVKIAKYQVGLNISEYLKQVILPIAKVLIISTILYFIIDLIHNNNIIFELIERGFTSLFVILILVWFIGMSSKDHSYLYSIIKREKIKG